MASLLPPLIGLIQLELREESTFLRALAQREDPVRVRGSS